MQSGLPSEALNIPHPGNPPFGRVTVSVGAATLSDRDLVSDETWIARADTALYRAKARGRNASVAEATGPGAEIMARPRTPSQQAEAAVTA